MHPVLIEVGGLTVSSYVAFHVLGAVTAAAVTIGLAARRGLPARSVLVLVVVTMTGVLVGARLWHVAANPSVYRDDPAAVAALRWSGLALYGGLVGGGIAALVAARRRRVPWWPFADVAAVGGLAGIALVRVGCFLNGCCFGEPTEVPWGVTFPAGSPAWARAQADTGLAGGDLLALAAHDYVPAVHPTQLYEALGAVVAAVVVVGLGRTRRPVAAGVAALVGAALFTGVRAVAWSMRAVPVTFAAPGWAYPAVWAAVIGGAALLARRLAVREADPTTAALRPPPGAAPVTGRRS